MKILVLGGQQRSAPGYPTAPQTLGVGATHLPILYSSGL